MSRRGPNMDIFKIYDGLTNHLRFQNKNSFYYQNLTMKTSLKQLAVLLE